MLLFVSASVNIVCAVCVYFVLFFVKGKRHGRHMQLDKNVTNCSRQFDVSGVVAAACWSTVAAAGRTDGPTFGCGIGDGEGL